MTAAEAHQQQLEQQQWYEDLENIRSDFNKNHGKLLGVAMFIRDNARGERDVQDAIKYLMQVLEEHDQIQRRLP